MSSLQEKRRREVLKRRHLEGVDTKPFIGQIDYAILYLTTIEVFGLQLLVLDLPTLVASKRAAGRPKDLLILPVIEALLRLREQGK